MEPVKLKRQIADAAIECLREKGYENTSVQDICDRAGIVRSTFYRMFSGKKEIIRFLLENTETNRIVDIEELLAARNDFDRMWIIGSRYLDFTERFGPEVLKALYMMTLNGDLEFLFLGHSVDEWFTRLTANCQDTGIVRNPDPPELLGPAMVDMVYHEIYKWCCHDGDYPLRSRCRRLTEMLAGVAPEYRWTEQQLKEADRKKP